MSTNWAPWASSSKLDRKDTTRELDHDIWLAYTSESKTWLNKTWAALISKWGSWAEGKSTINSAWAKTAMLTNYIKATPEKRLCTITLITSSTCSWFCFKSAIKLVVDLTPLTAQCGRNTKIALQEGAKHRIYCSLSGRRHCNQSEIPHRDGW
jgi:hypothetical protein